MPRVSFDGYQRGMLVRASPRAIPPGYVREALNLDDIGGRFQSRPGLRPAHGAAFPNPIRGGGTHYRDDGTRDYLIASGAAIYRMPLFGDPVLLPLTSLPSSEQTRVDPTAGVRFLSLSGADNVSFLFDGVNPNLKWNGTALTKMGLPVPTAPAAPTPNGGSAIGAGTRTYYRTLKTTVHESEMSAGLQVVQGPVGGEDFSPPVDGVDYDDPQVTSWALYRTTAGFVEPRLVATADISLPISDNLSDSAIGGKSLGVFFMNVAPSGLFLALVEHQSLLWGVDTTDRSLVRFSWGTDEYIVPEGWPTERVLPIAHGDGDEITALASFFDYLLVFKQLSTWAVTGRLDTGFKVVPVLASSGGRRLGIGCIAADAILHRENDLIFPSRDGFYVINRFASAEGGLQALKISDAIDELYNCTDFAAGSAALYDRQHQTYRFFGHG